MNTNNHTPAGKSELDEDDLATIRSAFEQKIIPKLRRHHARTGMLSCGFAGRAYASWMIRFRSVGNDFDITDYEYNQDGDGRDLVL